MTFLILAAFLGASSSLVGVLHQEAERRVVESAAKPARKVSILYASLRTGTVSVSVNGGPPHKVNVHASGSLTAPFIRATIPLDVSAHARVVLTVEPGDVPINVQSLRAGNDFPVDIWNLPPLPVAKGPYQDDWRQIGRRYSVPEWWRDAKFGAWAHWDPQSMPEQGDWYARGMYIEGSAQYRSHLQRFGHPSRYGYKDICHDWVVDRWKPAEMMDLFVEMGALYFMAMGVHHDNFDCWDSTYQPWNSVRVGPKRDIVGTWERLARQRHLRFGIGFHNTPGRTWGQFMTARYTHDRSGPYEGVPYDALATLSDGKGTWWEGLDPVDLYGPPHTIPGGPRRPENDPLVSPFANQFMWRVDDAITKYHPDLIYFDEHAGDSQVDLGVHMGVGQLGPVLAANFYNKSLAWHHGKMEAVLNLKGVGGQYNSFQTRPDLLPYVDRALVKSTEAVIEPEITAYPFQTETSIAEWHYQTGMRYMDARTGVRLLMENVCRNGTLLLNITQHGRGDLDGAAVRFCREMGAWLRVNGEAVYGSRPFEVYGEGDIRYTRNHGHVYATLLNWNGGPVTLAALRSGGGTLGRVSRVELVGSKVPFTFTQTSEGLTIMPSAPVESLAPQARVLRIFHDKGWINDDDPGAVAPGWTRSCGLRNGHFNNDLTVSNTPGDAWTCPFVGRSVKVIAPKQVGCGNLEVRIDGRFFAVCDLSSDRGNVPQQTVFHADGLRKGKHVLTLTHQGCGPVAVDAIVAE